MLAARQQIELLKQQLADTEADADINAILDQHATVNRDVLTETLKLHEGDNENRALWEEFLPKCLASIHEIYERLDVKFDKELGESFYHDRLAGVVESLRSANMAEESEGAVIVPVEGFAAPFMIQKKDGAFLYATSDLATIQYRKETWAPDAMLYVVDFRQKEHFDKLFVTAAKWGYDDLELSHVKFGTVLGEDGKPYKTRSGTRLGCWDYWTKPNERHSRWSRLTMQKSQALTEEERLRIARTVWHRGDQVR